MRVFGPTCVVTGRCNLSTSQITLIIVQTGNQVFFSNIKKSGVFFPYLNYFTVLFHSVAEGKPFLFLLSARLNRTKRIDNEICSTLK